MGAFVQAGLDMLSDSEEGRQKKLALEQNAAILTGEATDADAQAADAIDRGGLMAGRIRMAGTQALAKQNVAYANSGVDVSVGTPAAAAGTSAMYTELDAQTAINNAAREAWGHKKAATNYRREAAGARTALTNVDTATGLKIAGDFGKMGASAFSTVKGGG